MECEEIPYQIPNAPWDDCIFTYMNGLNLMVFCRVYVPVPWSTWEWFFIENHFDSPRLTSLECLLATIITCSGLFFVQFSSLKSWQHFHQPIEPLGPGVIFFWGLSLWNPPASAVSTNGSHSHPFGELAVFFLGISPWNIDFASTTWNIIASEPRIWRK